MSFFSHPLPKCHLQKYPLLVKVVCPSDFQTCVSVVSVHTCAFKPSCLLTCCRVACDRVGCSDVSSYRSASFLFHPPLGAEEEGFLQ